MEYPYLNKAKIKINFFLMLGTNKQLYKVNILFEEKNNTITHTYIAITFTSELKYNITSTSLNFIDRFYDDQF